LILSTISCGNLGGPASPTQISTATPLTVTDSFHRRHIRRCRETAHRTDAQHHQIASSGEIEHTRQCDDRQIDLPAHEISDDLGASSLGHGKPDRFAPRS
jgi:hypothetical protein